MSEPEARPSVAPTAEPAAKAPRPTWRSRLTPLVTRGPSALERARGAGPRQLDFYYEPGDAHSHLCAQLLPGIARRLGLPLRVHVVPAPEEAAYPEAERQRAFALGDARRIAPAWGLRAPGPQLPGSEDCRRAARTLLGAQTLEDFARREADCARALFGGEDLREAVRRHAALDGAAAARLLRANAQRRSRGGHYLPAMWHYDGEWFWGLDRLPLLEDRLRARDLMRGSEPLATLQPGAAALPEVPAQAPLEFWFSFRSPYSYLAAWQLAQQPALRARLQVRPVLPMAMRGFVVPRPKRLYIVRDCQRIADRLAIPFGHIADPIGEGARRCLAVFPLADGVNQQLDFLLSAGRAIWAEGIDVAQDEGLRFVVERAGLRWTRARAMLNPPLDIDYAQRNRDALFAAGLWGVPSFRIGTAATWGQDRLWLVDRLVAKAS